MVWVSLNLLPDFKSEYPTWTQLEASHAEYFSNPLSQLQRNLDYSDSAKERDYTKCILLSLLPEWNSVLPCRVQYLCPQNYGVMLIDLLLFICIPSKSWIFVLEHLHWERPSVTLSLTCHGEQLTQTKGLVESCGADSRPARSTGNEIPGLSWKNVTEEFKICLLSCGVKGAKED